MAAEPAKGRVVGAVHQERRQEQDQREFGIEANRRQSRNKSQRAAADQERRRRWQPDPRRDPMQGDHGCEQDEDQLEGFDRMHSLVKHASSGGEC